MDKTCSTFNKHNKLVLDLAHARDEIRADFRAKRWRWLNFTGWNFNTSFTASTTIPMSMMSSSWCISRITIQVFLVVSPLTLPMRADKSITGTTLPRRLITPGSTQASSAHALTLHTQGFLLWKVSLSHIFPQQAEM